MGIGTTMLMVFVRIKILIYYLCFLNVLGVVIISWSPTESTNTKENFIDVLLNKASKFNILIALKIEDYKGRNIESVFRYIKLLRQYTKHPSYYKHSKHGANLPVRKFNYDY